MRTSTRESTSLSGLTAPTVQELDGALHRFAGQCARIGCSQALDALCGSAEISYSTLVGKLLSSLDTRHLNESTYQYFLQQGIQLKNKGRVSISLLTTHGPVTYSRTILQPADPDSAQKLLDTYHLRTVIPLDTALGVDMVPLKMTPGMLVRLAAYGVDSPSYKTAGEQASEDLQTPIGSHLIYKSTLLTGAIVSHAPLPPDPPLPQGSTLYLVPTRQLLRWQKQQSLSEYYHAVLLFAVSEAGELLSRRLLARAGELDTLTEQLCKLIHAAPHTRRVLLTDASPWALDLGQTVIPGATVIADLNQIRHTLRVYGAALYSRSKRPPSLWTDPMEELISQGDISGALKMAGQTRIVECPELDAPLTDTLAAMAPYTEYDHYRAEGLWIDSAQTKVPLWDLVGANTRWSAECIQGTLRLIAQRRSGHWDEVERAVADFFKCRHSHSTYTELLQELQN